MDSNTQTLIARLAQAIAARTDIPALPEAWEAPAIEQALTLAIGQLPDEYIAMITSAADGIDDSEAAAVRSWIVDLMARYGSHVPERLRGWAADAVLWLLRKGTAVSLESIHT